MFILRIRNNNGVTEVTLTQDGRGEEETKRFHDVLSALIYAQAFIERWENDCENFGQNPRDQLLVELVDFPMIHPNQTTLDI